MVELVKCNQIESILANQLGYRCLATMCVSNTHDLKCSCCERVVKKLARRYMLPTKLIRRSCNVGLLDAASLDWHSDNDAVVLSISI